MTVEEITALATKLQECLECSALSSGLAVNIEIKLSRLQVLSNELRDIELQMEYLNSIRNTKLEEIESFENQVKDLRAQLLYNDCGSV